jgi:hypothetical protein
MADEKVIELLAKQEITEVVYRYCRAIDRMDEALLRGVFHPGSQHSHFYEGPSSDPSAPSSADAPGDFVAYAFGLLATYSRTHHQLGNTLIDLTDENRAGVETYFTAFHLVRPRSDPLAGDQAFDNEMDYFVGGRYIDRFEKRDGAWKIVHRTGMTDWVRIEPSQSQGFDGIPDETVGKRAPDDLICRFYSV